MRWKCPGCGYENEDSLTRCACGDEFNTVIIKAPDGLSEISDEPSSVQMKYLSPKTNSQIIAGIGLILIGIIEMLIGIAWIDTTKLSLTYSVIGIAISMSGFGILSGKRWGRILFWIFLPFIFLFEVAPLIRFWTYKLIGISYLAVILMIVFILSRPRTLANLGIDNPVGFFSRTALPLCVTLIMLFFDWYQSTYIKSFWLEIFSFSSALCIIATLVSCIPSFQKT